MEVVPKVFSKVLCSVVPESIVLNIPSWKEKTLKFSVKKEDNSMQEIVLTDSALICKFGQFHGFSMVKLFEDLVDKVTTPESTNEWVKKTVISKNRKVVLLLDEQSKIISLVSENHAQMPLNDIYNLVKAKAEELGMKIVSEGETKGSYSVEFEVANDQFSSSRVKVYLGRNDALGRSSVAFSGAGNIFVCSNMILPYVHRSIQAKTNMIVEPRRIVHVIGIDDKLRERITECLVVAQKQTFEMREKINIALGLEMPKAIQLYSIDLINKKFNFPKKYLDMVRNKLVSENETLFGLSQAFTFVGTHEAEGDMKEKLCKIGGQIVYLGNDFVKLMEEVVEKDNETQTRVTEIENEMSK